MVPAGPDDFAWVKATVVPEVTAGEAKVKTTGRSRSAHAVTLAVAVPRTVPSYVPVRAVSERA